MPALDFASIPAPTQTVASAPSRRLVSLDVLRGITVALMILVNSAGDGNASYLALRHSVWNGCTLADLVFPSFLFLMGVSLWISFQARHARHTPRSVVLLQVGKRAAILIVLGLLLNAFPAFHLSALRYCGVMQRIGLCYWIASILTLCLDWPVIAAFVATVLAGYWALLTLLPVPGFGRTGIELGVLNPFANLASAVDRMLIPQAHLYHQGFYDPEGVLSSLTAVATVLIGVLAARFLSTKQRCSHLWLAAAGAAMLLAALLWNPLFPINKRLWTSSYVLLCAGLSVLALCSLSWLLDRGRFHLSQALLTPWLAFGSNALVVYLFSELLYSTLGTFHTAANGNLQQLTYSLIPQWAGSAAMRSLEWSVLFTGICALLAFVLYRKRIFIKL